MNKIANAEELKNELRQLLAYCQTSNPSRSRIAETLNSISTRLAAEEEYEGESAEFAALMKEEWNGVKFDAKSGYGSLRYPPLGYIEFDQSGNDPAVWVMIKGPIRFKASPKDAADALEGLAKILNNTGV